MIEIEDEEAVNEKGKDEEVIVERFMMDKRNGKKVEETTKEKVKERA